MTECEKLTTFKYKYPRLAKNIGAVRGSAAYLAVNHYVEANPIHLKKCPVGLSVSIFEIPCISKKTVVKSG